MRLFDDIIEIDELIRSKRRTISITIDKDARTIVRAPLKMTISDINDFINLKSAWINKKKIEVLEQKKKRTKKLYVSGETFPFLGKEYPLVLIRDSKNTLEFKDNTFYLDINHRSDAERLFKLWYKKAAKQIINEKLTAFSSEKELKYAGFKINSARTRWGSCSSKKTLNFSYRLIMTPEFVIDYILIHELAHTIEMNHSARFWNIVRSLEPDYKKAEKWLRENSYSLEL